MKTGTFNRAVGRVAVVQAALLCALTLSACGGGDQAHCSDAEAALSEVNAARSQPRQCGGVSYAAAPPLAMSAVLTAAAERHAQDLAKTGAASHIGSDGSTVADRAAAYRRPVGENVAAGQTDLAWVMRDLLASPGHCRNLMNVHARQFGAACAQGGRVVWVQVFGV